MARAMVNMDGGDDPVILGLKHGLRSVHEYITGVPEPAKELCLSMTGV